MKKTIKIPKKYEGVAKAEIPFPVFSASSNFNLKTIEVFLTRQDPLNIEQIREKVKDLCSNYEIFCKAYTLMPINLLTADSGLDEVLRIMELHPAYGEKLKKFKGWLETKSSLGNTDKKEAGRYISSLQKLIGNIMKESDKYTQSLLRIEFIENYPTLNEIVEHLNPATMILRPNHPSGDLSKEYEIKFV